MAQFTGIVTVRVNGEIMNSLPGATMRPGGIARAAKDTDQRTGWTQTRQHAEVEFKIAHESDSELLRIHGIDDGTITYTTDTGVIYVVNHAFSMDPPVLEGGEATFKFGGDPAQEA